MGPMRGQRPSKVVIVSPDTAELSFPVTTGFLWWKETHFETVSAFYDGRWYWRRSGRPITGWAELDLNAAYLLRRREERERNESYTNKEG